MLTPEHFIWIGLCIILVVGMLRLSIKTRIRLKTAGIAMSGICILSELSKIMSDMVASPAGGMHLDPLCLPLHLCSLMIFVVLYITFGKEGWLKRLLINFLAVIGTLGSVCAILIPTNGTDFTTIFAYQCFIYHAGLLWFSLYLILSGEAKLGNIKCLGANTGVLTVSAFVMIYVNSALSAYDTNFFYLTRPPMENLPYLNLNHGWYVYFLRLLALGFVIMILFHLPFILQAHRHQSKSSRIKEKHHD